MSTDRKIPIDVDARYAELHDGTSSIHESWAEYQMKEWVKKLGVYSGDVALSHIGHLLYRFLILRNVPKNSCLQLGGSKLAK